MAPRSSYYVDLGIAWVFRVGLLCGVLAVLAMTACSLPIDTSMPDRKSGIAVRPPIAVGEKEAMTRNDTPQQGGCHEKSDSSLKEPLP